ncbi:PIN domain-containing protein [Leucobacter sp. Z1108]|uniref:PIN domain-containing protein n=1 Tax=Leucobacter sp. Z1108 TaxID=3439066 RepID=UPI003F41875B
MIAVVPDTNAVFKDPWLASPAGRRLKDLAAAGDCEIVFPEVVVLELSRRQHENVEEVSQDARVLVDKLSHHGTPMEEVSQQLGAAFAALLPKVETNFDALFDGPGLRREPVPADATHRLVLRDLARRRPFKEVGSDPVVSVGFRDAAIWETVLALLDPGRGYERVIFVAADRGFLDDSGNSLHGDLQGDLAELGIDASRLAHVRNVWHSATQVEKIVEATAEAAADAHLITVATNAVLALESENISMQMVYGGDYAYPDFVQFSVPFEDATIDAIDQVTEFTLTEDADTVTATAEILLSISGFVAKSDWYMEDGEIADWVEDWNEHYFHASSEVTVIATVTIDAGESAPVAIEVILTDTETDTSPG